MRRGLATVSLTLVFLGIELATEAVTLMVARLSGGFRSLAAGEEAAISPVRFGSGVLVLGGGLALWLLLVWSGRLSAAVGSVGVGCPDCGNHTRRVKRKGWHRLLSFLLGMRLTKRQCDRCGWNGLSERL